MIVLKITQAAPMERCAIFRTAKRLTGGSRLEHLHGGKTLKGLTDATLAWQTERFLELETHREGITVFVRPALVAEIALDGVQMSTRYPGGVALRFARLKTYRSDKDPAEADTIDSIRALLTTADDDDEDEA